MLTASTTYSKNNLGQAFCSITPLTIITERMNVTQIVSLPVNLRHTANSTETAKVDPAIVIVEATVTHCCSFMMAP
jgi:hypothetical protein